MNDKSFTLVGAEILRAADLVPGPLAIDGGLLTTSSTGPRVDASGLIVLPGIVDLHGDGFERHLAPRRGALLDMGLGLASVEAELAANGITTAVLAQFYSWEGNLRGPEFASRMLQGLDAYPAVTDMRPQLRYEIHMLDHDAAFLEMVDAHKVPYVVFNDHLPAKALAEGKRPPRLTGQALRARRNPDAHLKLLQDMWAARGQVPERLAALSAALLARGVQLGSHDDRTEPARADWRAMGVTISEFPETEEAARAATEAGDPVVLGAPNVLRGGSHAGNASALDLIGQGLCTALASDYYYPAPRRAALRLIEEGMSWGQAWALVAENPAWVLGLTDRGRIEDGLRADLVMLSAETRQIEATVVGGKITFASPVFAQRLLAAR